MTPQRDLTGLRFMLRLLGFELTVLAVRNLYYALWCMKHCPFMIFQKL